MNQKRTDLHPAIHASAPEGFLCADCSIDLVPCPECYAAWWRANHRKEEPTSAPDISVVQPPADV